MRDETRRPCKRGLFFNRIVSLRNSSLEIWKLQTEIVLYTLPVCGHYFVQYGFICVCIFYLIFWKASFSSLCVFCVCLLCFSVFSGFFCLFCFDLDVVFIWEASLYGGLTEKQLSGSPLLSLKKGNYAEKINKWK